MKGGFTINDRETALTAASGYLSAAKRLTQEEQAAMQAGIWELLAAQAARYTKGESSSVPMETAQELLRSIHFCIDIRLGEADAAGMAEALRRTPLPELYEQGLMKVWLLAEEGKALLREAQRNALSIDNHSYHDTLRELPDFFRRYDYRYFAHSIPCMIDYQLLYPLPGELLGVGFINEYLRGLALENRFCAAFDGQRVERLLRAYCPDYRELLINLCDAVFTNALGLTLLGRDPLPLDIGDGERAALLECFRPWDGGAAAELVRRAVGRLCSRLRILDTRSRAYFQEAGRNLLPRIRATDGDHWRGLFLSLRR